MPDRDQRTDPVGAATETFAVIGMTCDHCVQAVTNELGKLDGVSRVDVDLTTGTATVETSAPLDRAVVAAAVDEAGFELAP